MVRRQQEWVPSFLKCLKPKILNRENLSLDMQIIIFSRLTNYLIICNDNFQFEQNFHHGWAFSHRKQWWDKNELTQSV